MKNRALKFRFNSVVRGVTTLMVVWGLFAATGTQTALAASFTVNSTADTVDASPGNGVCADSIGNCTLRAAIMETNALAGADTITLPAGTYLLTLANAGGVNEDNDATGDLDINGSLTINGAGAGSTIIEAGTNTTNGIDKVIAVNPICTSPINVTLTGVTVRFGRNSQPYGAADFSFTGGGIDWCANGSGSVFTLSNSVVTDNTNVNGYGGGLNVDSSSATSFTVNITNDTFQNNRTLSTVNESNGGAINLFGSGLTVNITNSTFTGNLTTNPTSGGGAIYFRPTTASALSISGSTFSSNTAPGIGGAIATNTYGAGTTVSIQNSTFTGNTATNSFGGALDLGSTNLNTTPFSLSHLTITGNTAGISGGGVYVGNSNVTLSKSLIVGNSAPTGGGLHKSVDVATATVINNWWGCSTGPSATPCDRAATSGGTLNFTPWYRDQLTATTSPIVTNQSTALTSSFLTNSASSAVPVADLAEIIGRSVTWAATNGNLSGTQGTLQSAGTATGSFQATAAGTAIISAKVDNDNTAPVSANVLSLTVNKADTTTAINSDMPDPTVTGQPVTVTFSVTGTFGNSPTAPTGNVTVSDGTNSCTDTIAAGQCTLSFTSAGAKSLTATYAGDSNFNGSSSSPATVHTVNKADTTTTITSGNPDPSVVGQTVIVSYTVTVNAPGSGIPTGNVTVSDGTGSCIGTVAAGQCSLLFTTAGGKSLTATYAGDTNFNGSASENMPHQVNKADTTTMILSDLPDPSNIGQSVIVTYSVSVNAPGGGTPTGSVIVSDGLDSCSGTAAASACTINFSSGGTKTLTATYAGDSNFNGSISDGVSHQVIKAATTTTVTSSLNPSSFGQAVTFTATVTSTAGTPPGLVTFQDGATALISVTLSNGVATFTSAALTTGDHAIHAQYDGDANYLASTAELTQTVQEAAIVDLSATSSSPTILGNPTFFTATLGAGSNVTFTWDFGDNSPLGNSPTITHVYNTGGQYQVVVTATNSVNVVTATTSVLVLKPRVSLPLMLRSFSAATAFVDPVVAEDSNGLVLSLRITRTLFGLREAYSRD